MFGLFQSKEKKAAEGAIQIVYHNATQVGYSLSDNLPVDLARSNEFIAALFSFVDSTCCMVGADTLKTFSSVCENILKEHSYIAIKGLQRAITSPEGEAAGLNVMHHLSSLPNSGLSQSEGMSFLVKYMRKI